MVYWTLLLATLNLQSKGCGRGRCVDRGDRSHTLIMEDNMMYETNSPELMK